MYHWTIFFLSDSTQLRTAFVNSFLGGWIRLVRFDHILFHWWPASELLLHYLFDNTSWCLVWFLSDSINNCLQLVCKEYNLVLDSFIISFFETTMNEFTHCKILNARIAQAFDRIIVHRSGDFGLASAKSATMFMFRLMKHVADAWKKTQQPVGGFLSKLSHPHTYWYLIGYFGGWWCRFSAREGGRNGVNHVNAEAMWSQETRLFWFASQLSVKPYILMGMYANKVRAL